MISKPVKLHLSILAKLHILIDAKKHHIKLSKSCEQYLQDYIKRAHVPSDVPISFLYFLGTHGLNASYWSIFPKSKSIMFNVAWAKQIILYPTDVTFISFCASLGHETTHLERNDLSLDWQQNPCQEDINFISWVNEVHADYGAVAKYLSSSRKDMLKTIDYKISLSSRSTIDDDSHPSWVRRKDYIKTYNFNRVLIEKIAADTNCTNRELIKAASSHFHDIILA